MLHVEILYSQLQSRNVDSKLADKALRSFTAAVQNIRDGLESSESLPESATKKRRVQNDLPRIAKDVCDTIVLQCRERFGFTHHLEASTLVSPELFSQYKTSFPDERLSKTIRAYPFLQEKKLKM